MDERDLSRHAAHQRAPGPGAQLPAARGRASISCALKAGTGRLELLFSFKGVERVGVPEERIHRS